MVDVFNIGLRFGKYELTRKLAEGGFGTLFVVRDTALDRDQVIKFLLPEHANNAQVVQRFLQEGRSLAKITHPGIVTVYETGEVRGSNTRADGAAYIMMELLVGETLTQRLARVGRLSVSAAMEICRQVANALQAAHEMGIVHRDLKPDNIMLVSDPALSLGERAKILDFGIAKLAGNQNATQVNLVFGTPVYMSPEQAKSTAGVTHSSDIYSLGCILFELLVGKPPFDGGVTELIIHHMMTPAPVPSALAPGIPPHLDQVLGAMMAKTPEERPASMKVVEAILEEKRVVASMARRRTIGGAKLATQPPPMGPASLAAAGRPVVTPVTPPIGVPIAAPRVTPPSYHAQPNPTPQPMPAQPAPSTNNAEDATIRGQSPFFAGGLQQVKAPTSNQATVVAQHIPIPASIPSSSHATVVAGMPMPMPYDARPQQAPAQWPAASAPQAIALPEPTAPLRRRTSEGSNLALIAAAMFVLVGVIIAVIVVVVSG